MVNLQISESFEELISEDLLLQAAEAALHHEGQTDEVELSIVIADDQAIQELNAQFRGVDAPTDVLSFPADEYDPDEQYQYLGDIMISYPRAVAQALVAQHPVINEIRLLVVHGVLHLLGYDHLEPEEKAEMWTIQAEILSSIGCEIKQLPEK